MSISSSTNVPALYSLGDYNIRIAPEGFATIQQISSGEIFHLRSAPIEEARSLYLEQAGLDRLLAEPGEAVIIWDVGLGAAANAMAAIHGYETHAGKGFGRGLTLVSFENDLHPLELALRHLDLFPYLDHPAPASILRRGEWRSKEHAGLNWLLVRGDFARTISETLPAPGIIFYDLFSSQTYPGYWTLALFQRLFAVCASRATKLLTYSRSTSARAALLAAGFHVARGRPSAAQEESTIALTPSAVEQDCRLLGSAWLDRWERSRAKYPALLPADQRSALENLIRNHPSSSQIRELILVRPLTRRRICFLPIKTAPEKFVDPSLVA